MKVFNKVKGVTREDLAINYIRKVKKYKIVERNYKNKIGEIDIIAQDRDTTIFVEVKYRTTARYGLGREAVDSKKINKIRNVATQYLIETKKINCKVRFDVVDVLDEEITYIENAF